MIRPCPCPAEAGAPWHAQDAEGYTAGVYASGSGHKHIVTLLLDFAVRAELILGGWAVGRARQRGNGAAARAGCTAGAACSPLGG